MNRATRRAFGQAAGALIAAFEQAGPFPGQEVTPPLLADAVRQCLDICQRVDADEEELPLEEVDELGTHGLECLSDLGLWAWQLKLDDIRAALEDLALDLAQWIVSHGGQVAVLEQVVNALVSADHPMNTIQRLWHPKTFAEANRKLIEAFGKDWDEMYPLDKFYQDTHLNLFPKGIVHAENLGGDITNAPSGRYYIGAFMQKAMEAETMWGRFVAFREGN